MENRAIIDIGSNSIKVLIYEVNSCGFRVIDSDKRRIRLSCYLDDNRYLAEEGINKAINTLKEFKALCSINSVKEIYAVATEAIRRAENKCEFCNKVKLQLGIDIRILSGDEEAFYGYLAIKNSINEKNGILLDIGGASLEMTLLRDGNIKSTVSLPLGSIPLTKMFNNVLKPSDNENLEKFIVEQLDNIPWIKKNNNLNIIGIGGTARNIGKVNIIGKNKSNDNLNNYDIKINEIEELYKVIQGMNIKERDKIEGLSKERIEIFTAPLGAILNIMKYCNSSKLIISELGVKEGVIYQSILGEKDINKD